MATREGESSPSASIMNPPSPSVDEVLACQLSNWYEKFRGLPKDSYSRKSVTIKSVVLPVPASFIEYLLSDGVQLPLDATKISSCIPKVVDPDDDDSWGEEDDEDDATESFSFPELSEQIQSAIDTLGGAVLPKLNWSCPKDATWINGGTLKCQTPGDVYILLKSSDFCMHDILHAFDNATGEPPSHINYELVLRQWCNLNPSMEFRSFVASGDVVAISQRNHTQHFPHLSSEKLIVRSQILDFYDEYIQENFPGKGNYSFDVYIDKQERVWLLDFNVWGSQTDSLLFSWEELLVMATSSPVETNEDVSLLTNERPEIRIVETPNEIHHDPLASYRAPIDTVDLATMTSSDASQFQDFMAMCKKPSAQEEEED